MDIILLLCIKSMIIRNGVTLSTVYQLCPLRTTVIVYPWVQNYERKYLIQVIKLRCEIKQQLFQYESLTLRFFKVKQNQSYKNYSLSPIL